MNKFSFVVAGLTLMFAGCNKTADSPGENMMTLPPLKDQFADYFLMGNIVVPGDVDGQRIGNQRLTRHYNTLTAENAMKPQYLSPNPGAYSWEAADRIVDAAIASGFKMVGHTLLWHSQIPQWQRGMASSGKDTALATMKKFVTDVVTHYRGRIYSWDVLNEVFPDDVRSGENWRNAMRDNLRGGQGANPWYMAIGADFVYEGYLAARLADPSAFLYYNDYNLNQSIKATMVRNMVHDINEQWKNDPQYDGRLLIEGIGMQSHHNTGVRTYDIRNSLELFKPLGVKISISELDVLSQSWDQFNGNKAAPNNAVNQTANTTATDDGKERAANLYGEYFKLFLEYRDIIERVTFWGVYDEQSWRSKGLPLLFEGGVTSTAKSAYYKVIAALNDER